MSRLDSDVAITGPIACKATATILRAARAVRKDDDRILPRVVGIKNSNVKFFPSIRVMQDEVCDFRDCVGAGLQVVAVRVIRRRNLTSRWGASRWLYRWRRSSYGICGQLSGREAGASRSASDEIGRNRAQGGDH